uniref:ubiquitinyl hydrolase 1 n=1 Tax=Capra hircus TaxID=9925 RepID=A0A452EIC4_CAPHI
EGSLCAQLCLNNLLQEEYFRPGELSSVAHQLGENGRRSASEDYHTFLQQPSGNMDHRAFYSIQVINNALKITFLSLFLEGYSIFVVKDDLPDCDQLLQMTRVQQMHRPKLTGEELAQPKEQRVQKTDLERVLE